LANRQGKRKRAITLNETKPANGPQRIGDGGVMATIESKGGRGRGGGWGVVGD